MLKRILLVIVALLMFSPIFCQWRFQYTNPLGRLNSIFFIDGNNGWAVGENGSILHYNGSEWSLQKSNVTCFLYSVFFLDRNNGWVVGDSGTILKYNGTTWEKQTSGTLSPLSSVFFTDVNNGWVSKYCCDMLKYDGLKWSTPNTEVYNNLTSIYLLDSKNGWLAGDRIFKLSDTIWEIDYSPVIKRSYFFTSLSFINASCGWAVGAATNSTGLILKYSNSEWKEDTIGMNNVLLGVHFRNNNLGWAVGQNGAIYKFNGFKWYKQLVINNKEYAIRNIYFADDNKGWVVCVNGDILYTDNAGDTITSINQNTNNYKIELGNYPNPFTDQTTIKYTLVKSGRIILNIYDNFGGKINTLLDEVQEQGVHTVIFNPYNLPQGIYYYTLQTGYIKESRRMVLIK